MFKNLICCWIRLDYRHKIFISDYKSMINRKKLTYFAWNRVENEDVRDRRTSSGRRRVEDPPVYTQSTFERNSLRRAF